MPRRPAKSWSLFGIISPNDHESRVDCSLYGALLNLYLVNCSSVEFRSSKIDFLNAHHHCVDSLFSLSLSPGFQPSPCLLLVCIIIFRFIHHHNLQSLHGQYTRVEPLSLSLSHSLSHLFDSVNIDNRSCVIITEREKEKVIIMKICFLDY